MLLTKRVALCLPKGEKFLTKGLPIATGKDLILLNHLGFITLPMTNNFSLSVLNIFAPNTIAQLHNALYRIFHPNIYCI